MSRFGIGTRDGYPYAPVGSIELFRLAIEALGRRENSNRIDVIGAINDTAQEFAFNAWEEIRAPRVADLRQTLTAHLEALVALRESFHRLDSHSILELKMAGAFEGPWFKRPAAAALSARESDALWSGEESVILALLDAQIRATKMAFEGLPLDKGGRGTSMTPSAKYCLVASCVAIAHFWNPTVISATEGGALRAFVSYVYEIATGREGVDLESDVKKCVRKYRKIVRKIKEGKATISIPAALKIELEQPGYASASEIIARAARKLSPDAEDGDQISDRN